MRSDDPADLWQAHRQLSDDWARTVERLRAMPEGSEHQRVAGEWSAVQTLRHLVFVHDSWFRRCCLGSTQPFTGIGYATGKSVAECLRVVLNEQWEHHRFCVRDLDVLSADGDQWTTD